MLMLMPFVDGVLGREEGVVSKKHLERISRSRRIQSRLEGTASKDGMQYIAQQ